jgi:hypothetical protein
VGCSAVRIADIGHFPILLQLRQITGANKACPSHGLVGNIIFFRYLNTSCVATPEIRICEDRVNPPWVRPLCELDKTLATDIRSRLYSAFSRRRLSDFLHHQTRDRNRPGDLIRRKVDFGFL